MLFKIFCDILHFMAERIYHNLDIDLSTRLEDWILNNGDNETVPFLKGI